MKPATAIHHTFTIERRYPAQPERIFAAWQDPRTKRRWFTDDAGEHTLDFRVDGMESVRMTTPEGKTLVFATRYLDIVDGQRIVYTSTLSADDRLSTSSITSVELAPAGDGTVLVLTESAIFLDGQELPEWREQGTSDWLTRLGAEFATVTS